MTKGTKWRPFEIVLTTTSDYAKPYLEVDLSATFTGPEGQSLKLSGFWDGDKTWRVRFAPTTPGVWSWTTECSNPDDSDLHGQSGQCVVGTGESHSPVYEHGFVVSKGASYLQRADGSPFLWLGDTCWGALAKATWSEWKRYVETRKAQNFNVLQSVIFFHEGWFEANNGPVFTDIDKYETPNVDYFKNIDTMVAYANEQGMHMALVMLWHCATPWTWFTSERMIHQGPKLTQNQAVRFAQYCVARYSAYDVSWMTTGDGITHSGTKKPIEVPVGYNNAMGKAIASLDPHDHPRGVHVTGGHTSTMFFADQDWTNYTMYQARHKPDDSSDHALHYTLAQESLRSRPDLPIIDGEPCYESQGGEQGFADGVRRNIIWSYLAGARAVTYGANQVFKWWRGKLEPGDPPFWAHAYDTGGTWETQLAFVGANQLRHVRAALESVNWWELAANQEAVVNQSDNPLEFIALTASEKALIAYMPLPGELVLSKDKVPFGIKAGVCEATWFNPETGETQPATLSDAKSTVTFTTPKSRAKDWMLVVKKSQQ